MIRWAKWLRALGSAFLLAGCSFSPLSPPVSPGPAAGTHAAAPGQDAGAAPGAPAAMDAVRVNVFPGASNLPLFVGVERGVFARYGIAVQIINTPNSESQRAGLARGEFEIAQSAVDNAVAMVEVAGADVAIVAGGDGSMNELVVRPEVRSLNDVRGKVLVVDAPNTAYALVARKILKSQGLVDGVDYRMDPVGGTPLRVTAMTERADCVAGMLNPPWSFIAESKGLKSLGRQLDLFGPYQSSGVFVMRGWGQAHRDLLERYLAASVEATRLAMDPANRDMAVGVLAARLKLERSIAERTYDALMVPGWGLAADGRFDMAGFRNVLALRAEIEGQWNGHPPPPEKYVDLSFYDGALRRIGR